MTGRDTIKIELLQEERAAILQWAYPFDDLRAQLEEHIASDAVATVTIRPFYLAQLIGDLCHAIAKRDCRDQDVIDLCDRLEYIERSGDGQLDWMY